MRLGDTLLCDWRYYDLVQNGLNIALRLLLRSRLSSVGRCDGCCECVEMAWTFAITVPILDRRIPDYLLDDSDVSPCAKKWTTLCARAWKLTPVLRVIRAFNHEEKKFSRLGEYRSVESSATKGDGLSRAANPITFVIIVILYGGAIKVDTGTLTRVIALTNYMSQILVELVKFANLVVLMTKSVASAERINTILSIEADMVENLKMFILKAECQWRLKTTDDHVSG